MTNGKMDSAEIDALLTSGRLAVDKYLLTSIQQLGVSLDELRKACDERGRTCPGMHPPCLDAADPTRALSAESSRRTWAMWSVGTTLLRELALPLVIVLGTLLLAGKL
jgi:hypothetical protein